MSLTLVSFQTVSKGESYFEAYKKYQAWEQFIKHIKQDILSKDSPLQSIYQTSEFWKKVSTCCWINNGAVWNLELCVEC